MFNNINFAYSLKKVLDENIIEKIYYKQITSLKNKYKQLKQYSSIYDKRLKEAYLYTMEAVKNLIITSPDRKIITDKSREKAKIITLKKFNYS